MAYYALKCNFQYEFCVRRNLDMECYSVDGVVIFPSNKHLHARREVRVFNFLWNSSPEYIL
jgi:hypothetical protein